VVSFPQIFPRIPTYTFHPPPVYTLGMSASTPQGERRIQVHSAGGVGFGSENAVLFGEGEMDLGDIYCKV
jgi:hypothetical protein